MLDYFKAACTPRQKGSPPTHSEICDGTPFSGLEFIFAFNPWSKFPQDQPLVFSPSMYVLAERPFYVSSTRFDDTIRHSFSNSPADHFYLTSRISVFVLERQDFHVANSPMLPFAFRRSGCDGMILFRKAYQQS